MRAIEYYAPEIQGTWAKSGYLFENGIFISKFEFFRKDTYFSRQFDFNNPPQTISWGKGVLRAFADYQVFNVVGAVNIDFESFISDNLGSYWPESHHSNAMTIDVLLNNMKPAENSNSLGIKKEDIEVNMSINTNVINNLLAEPIQKLIDDMVVVEGGEFIMGPDQSDQTKKTTIDTFKICKYVVSQSLWETVVGYNKSNHKGNRLPVVCHDYVQIQDFIAGLIELTGLQFRLPTDEEWVFAGRGGNKSLNYKYSGSNILNLVGWFNDNSRNSPFNSEPQMQEIGKKKPNELDLYDMSGNVKELCVNHFNNNIVRKVKGGSFKSRDQDCAICISDNKDYWNINENDISFRLVL